LPQRYRFRVSGWLKFEQLKHLVDEIQKTGLIFDGIAAWDNELVLLFQEADEE